MDVVEPDTPPAEPAWHDVVAVVRRRWPLCQLVLVGARVQGEEAPREIVGALAAGDLNGDAKPDVAATAWGPTGQLVWFENCDHSFMNEEPGAFIHVIREFLSDIADDIRITVTRVGISQTPPALPVA